METKHDDTFLLRTYDKNFQKIWLMFNGTKILRGLPKESKRSLVAKWIAANGPLKPRSVTRYAGVMRPAEVAMTIGEIQNEDCF